MNELLAAATSSRTTGTLNLRWLLGAAVVLPAVIAAVDYAILGRIVNEREITLETGLQFGWYVMQVGLVGYVVGRGQTLPLMRWIVFGWVLLLINLLSLTAAMNPASWRSPTHLPPAALFSGQIGLCVVWAFFGDGWWRVRWPAMTALGAVIFLIWAGAADAYSREMWTELLVLQVATLTVLCGLLRWRGFRLERIAPEGAGAAGAADRRRLQFGINHVLVWTTALAILLGVAKALDLLTWEAAQQLARGGIFWKLTVATTSAIVIIVALWAALGRGHWLVRIGVALLFTLAAGAGLGYWSVRKDVLMQGVVPGPGYWELRYWLQVGWWWVGWLFLSGGLLAATLIILRMRDYRLVRAPSSRAASAT